MLVSGRVKKTEALVVTDAYMDRLGVHLVPLKKVHFGKAGMSLSFDFFAGRRGCKTEPMVSLVPLY